MGQDGAPMDHISSRDNLQNIRRKLEINLAHNNTRETKLDDF